MRQVAANSLTNASDMSYLNSKRAADQFRTAFLTYV